LLLVTLLPDDGENVVNRDRVLEISSVCDRSRDPDLLREMGRGTAVRPLVTVCCLSNDADLSRDRADNVVRRDELLNKSFISNVPCQWERRNFDPPQLPHFSPDLSETQNEETHPGHEPACKIW